MVQQHCDETASVCIWALGLEVQMWIGWVIHIYVSFRLQWAQVHRKFTVNLANSGHDGHGMMSFYLNMWNLCLVGT